MRRAAADRLIAAVEGAVEASIETLGAVRGLESRLARSDETLAAMAERISKLENALAEAVGRLAAHTGDDPASLLKSLLKDR